MQMFLSMKMNHILLPSQSPDLTYRRFRSKRHHQKNWRMYMPKITGAALLTHFMLVFPLIWQPAALSTFI